MDSQNPTRPLLSTATTNSDEQFLLRFHSSLKYCALDHSSSLSRTISYLTFLTLTVIIPISYSHLLHTAASSLLSELPESILAIISFFTLSSSFQHLLLNGLRHDSPAVRRAYTREIDRAFRHLAAILLPSFAVQLAHKTFLFASPAAAQPWKAAALAAALASWVYRTGVFLLVCVFFRMTCELQILRFEEFYKMFEQGSGAVAEVEAEAVMFREHLRIRRLLKAMSHRYRIFIIGCVVTITVSQLGALVIVFATKGDRNFCNSGDLVVCSVVQLSGFLMCLFGAARITHRAQRVVSIASRWHMIMSSSSTTKLETIVNHDESDGEDCESKNSFQPLISQTRSSFESRQALVTYLQHNGGGITIFGFALDRGLLHTLFAFEMTLVLWILSKVVVLS
ncbi:uncharacterized protein LOC110098925 [Dendrobium catenatum]|uniref:Uncharacterized protein n=1 Tax=Dendrobium catenatum TaxID=906689 RepID=A0A2I0VNE8_9ASPA|nr:uncharacterized protein LOC110098925 [Dendrobium catenatum]PKU64927.1 hypothetical protein MA16_Dca004542 [Dendrobium catenatum]